MQGTKGNAYMVPEGGVLDGVLSCQGNAAKQNEEEDQVGEDRVIDNAVTLEAKSVWGGEKDRNMSGRQGKQLLGLWGSTLLCSTCERCLSVWGWALHLRSCCWVMTTTSHPRSVSPL